MYSVCGQDCETQSELDYSLNSLDSWLAQHKDASPALRTFTEDFLVKSFKARIDKLGQCHFQHLYGGTLGSNSMAEQENSALKRSPMGPRNNSGIDRSVEAMVRYETGRLKEMHRRGLLSLSQTAVEDSAFSEKAGEEEEQSDSMDSGIMAGIRTVLSKVLVDHAVNDLIQQWSASIFYKYLEFADSKFYVRRSTWVNTVNTMKHVNNMIDHAHIPKFDRTRVVNISNSK